MLGAEPGHQLRPEVADQHALAPKSEQVGDSEPLVLEDDFFQELALAEDVEVVMATTGGAAAKPSSASCRTCKPRRWMT